MEIFNLKEIEIFFEDCKHTKIDAKGIEFVSLNEYEYLIGDDKVYGLYIELPIDKSFILKPDMDDKCYEDNPIRHLYAYDDVVDIDLYYQNGTKGNIKAYWGKFNIDEINLYQHGKYQVNKDGELTGKFILELYVEKLSDDLQSQIDKRKKIRDCIYETLWEHNPLEFGTFNGKRPVNVYRDESNVLTNYIYYNRKHNLSEFKTILLDSEKSQWSEYLDAGPHRENLDKVAEIIYKNFIEGEK